MAPSEFPGTNRVEIASSSAVNVTIGASPIRHVGQGDTYEVERGTPHNVTNASTSAPAALLITYLKDKGVPWKIDVPPPAIR